MQSLEEIYNRLKQKKDQRRELKGSFQDELKNNARYQEIIAKMNELKAEKKSIENEIFAQGVDKAKLEELMLDIKTDIELLTDIVLTKFIAQEPVEIVDDMNNRWSPAFKVQFKKA